MKLSKIPKHIWLGVLLPLVLVGLGAWRLWPIVEEYREKDELLALDALVDLTELALCVDCPRFTDEGGGYGTPELKDIISQQFNEEIHLRYMGSAIY